MAFSGQPSSKSPSNSILLNKVDELIKFVNDTNFDDKSNNKSWAIDANKKKEEFRNYEDNPRKKAVEEFYKNQHENVTYDFVMKQRENYLKFDKCVMTMYVHNPLYILPFLRSTLAPFTHSNHTNHIQSNQLGHVALSRSNRR